MFNYLGELIIFLAAVVAIKGGTWDKSKTGIKRLTVTGLITMVLALLGFVTSLVITWQSNQESKVKSMQITEAVSNTREAKEKAKVLDEQLSTMEVQLEAYKTILKAVRVESERQPQQVMAQYVPLEPGQIWRAPNLIYSGSIIKFYGFTSGLLLRYGSHRQIIPAGEGGSHPVEIAIIGRSGEKMHWSVENITRQFCHGKIFVESTPRTRSIDWSWLEERIKPDGTLK